jgi:hypothetical protein
MLVKWRIPDEQMIVGEKEKMWARINIDEREHRHTNKKMEGAEWTK